jgi:hypothetical protein
MGNNGGCVALANALLVERIKTANEPENKYGLNVG